MNEIEIIDLLTWIAGYSNRTTGQSDIVTWLTAAQRSSWTFEEALEAVHTHYANTDIWIMPGHITQIIKTHRRQPPPYKNQTALTSPPAKTQTRNEAMTQIRAILNPTKTTKTETA
jgi:hypothetical protein